MRSQLWGGPHDGAVVVIDGEPDVWHEAVPLTAAEAYARDHGPDGVVARVHVAEYKRSPRGRYEYVGQHWL